MYGQETEQAILELDAIVKQNGALLERQAAPVIETQLAAGKQLIADAITNRGILTTSGDSLNQMAKNINAIEQTPEPLVIDSDQYYSSVIWGDYLYDIFQVADNIINEYTPTYSGFILAKYYRTFSAITLQGADAYLTSDGDFYTSNVTHIWHDDNSTHADRWIAFLHTNSGYTFSSTVNGLCPRELMVVGECSAITIDYNQLSQLYIPENLGHLGNFNTNSNGTPGAMWSANIVIDNYTEHSNGVFLRGSNSITNSIIFSKLKSVTNGIVLSGVTFSACNAIDFPSLESATTNQPVLYSSNCPSVNEIKFPKLKVCSCMIIRDCKFNGLEHLEFPSLEIVTTTGYTISNSEIPNIKSFSFPQLKTVTGNVALLHLNNTGGFPKLEKIDLPLLETVSNKAIIFYGTTSFKSLKEITYPSLITLDNGSLAYGVIYSGISSYLPILEEVNCSGNGQSTCATTNVYMPSLKKGTYRNAGSAGYAQTTTKYIHIGAKGETGDTITVWNYGITSLTIEIGDKENIDAGLTPRWEPRQPLVFTNIRMTAEDIALKILDRLADNTSGSRITINIGVDNLNRINADATYAPYVAAATAKNYLIK